MQSSTCERSEHPGQGELGNWMNLHLNPSSTISHMMSTKYFPLWASFPELENGADEVIPFFVEKASTVPPSHTGR